jgi:hypothetical protein
MGLLRTASGALVFASALLSLQARGEQECKNLVIHMSNSAPDGGTSKVGNANFSGEGTVVFVCNGSELEVRDQVSIHMMNATDNGICYTDFSCGNLHLWAGIFAIGARTMNASLFEFLCSGAYRHLPIDAPHISVDAQFDYFEVSRHCKPMSAPICVNPR